MQLSKKERHKIYVKALEKFNEYPEFHTHFGLCRLFFEVLDNYSFWYLANKLPEFYSKKPNNRGLAEFWWEYKNVQIRREILQQLINETK
jgi:hypothetical protein